jgi:hypothetical protein
VGEGLGCVQVGGEGRLLLGRDDEGDHELLSAAPPRPLPWTREEINLWEAEDGGVGAVEGWQAQRNGGRVVVGEVAAGLVVGAQHIVRHLGEGGGGLRARGGTFTVTDLKWNTKASLAIIGARRWAAMARISVSS